MIPIYFFFEYIQPTLFNKKKVSKWINDTICNENKQLKNLNIIFCNDTYLLEKNITYLKHHTFTDVITFDQSDDQQTIEGDIYISIECVKDNAYQYKVDFKIELLRVMIHGVLHLLGYKDKHEQDKNIMNAKEDQYLEKYFCNDLIKN